MKIRKKVDNLFPCTKCNKLYKKSFFKPSKLGKWGIASWCRKCTRKRDMTYQRKRRATSPGLKAKEFRIYKFKYPDRVKAQQILNRAINNGFIKKEPCEKCGKKKVHAHHPDYRFPLKVRWLCPVDHKEIHPITK